MISNLPMRGRDREPVYLDCEAGCGAWVLFRFDTVKKVKRGVFHVLYACTSCGARRVFGVQEKP